MTSPEERAAKIIDRLLHGTYGDDVRFDLDQRQRLRRDIVAVIEGAVEQERERAEPLVITLHNIRLWLAARAILDGPSIVTKQVILDTIDSVLAQYAP